MAEPASGHERWLVAHHVLERLTVVKVRIGLLRLRLRLWLSWREGGSGTGAA